MKMQLILLIGNDIGMKINDESITVEFEIITEKIIFIKHTEATHSVLCSGVFHLDITSRYSSHGNNTTLFQITQGADFECLQAPFEE